MLSIGIPCLWESLKFYGTYRTTKSSAESGLIMEFWGEGRMNREMWIDELQVIIEIFNLRGLDECNCVETRTYPCGDRSAPIPVIIMITL